MQKKSQKFSIAGMHCKSCELLIEEKIKIIPGVTNVEVSQINNSLELLADRTISNEQITQALNGTEYTLATSSETNAARASIPELGAIALILLATYFILSKFDLVPSFDLSKNVTLGVAFATGLVAAFSSCIAVSGGLLLALSTRYRALHPAMTSVDAIKINGAFNVGRILSYTLFGGLLGVLGNTLTISPKISGVITIIASIAMILVGFRLLNLFPGLQRFAPSIPKWVSRRMPKADSRVGIFRIGFLGASTFFLPCGFTQALQLYVLSNGSMVGGSLIMLAFSLGTLPALLSVGAFTAMKNQKWQKRFSKVAGVAVLLIGITTVRNGLTLAGVTSPQTISTPVQSLMSNNAQLVTMNVNGLDYSPDAFTVRRGIPVLWRVDGTGARGCARVLTIPSLGITKYLSHGINEITFTPPQTGVLQFTCSMGMAGPGQFNVID